MYEFFSSSENTVAVSFVLFVALLWYLGVHKKIGAALDSRAEGIRNDLDEARQAREEAQSLLASFERKQKEADAQVEDIVAKAKADAEQAAADAKDALKVAIARRLQSAQEQLAAAEAAAVREVKDRAVAVAIEAAANVIKGQMDAKTSGVVTKESIGVIAGKLH